MSGVPSVNIGTLLAGRWIVGAPLGSGVNGEVYDGEEAQGGRLCAVKILDPSFRRGGPAWSAFQSEVRTVSALPAEGIARVYDLGIDGKLHRPFVACERVMFPSLARYVADRGPIDPGLVYPALVTVARALDQMHGAGVAHGALKPQNVFVSTENPSWARITDYSLARLKAAIDPNHSSLGWTPPELVRGGVPEPAGDRFALALVAFFALTGMPWFSGLGSPGLSRSGRWGVLDTMASARAKELGGFLDPAFDQWFRASLAGDPASRYSTASEMAQALGSIVESLAASDQGPHSGPGVVSAVARPLVFRRDLPAPQPAHEPAAAPMSYAGADAQPLSSVAHPFSPTVRAMPAMAAPPAPAPDAATAATVPAPYVYAAPAAYAPTDPQYPALASRSGRSPAGWTQSTEAHEGEAAVNPALPPAQPNFTFPRGAVIGLLVAGGLLFTALAAGAVLFVFRGSEETPATASSAVEPPSAPSASSAPVAASATAEAAPRGFVPASPNVPPPPAIMPKPKPAPGPAPKPAAKPTATTKATATAKATATSKPAAKATATAKPAAKTSTKKCGTFINPCK